MSHSEVTNLGRIGSALKQVKENATIRFLDTYQYTPINNSTSIRLLRIHNDEESILRCTIYSEDLETNPKYSALSYTWSLDRGFGHRTKAGGAQAIRCNDRKMTIGRNLYNAMLRLKYILNGASLWVDQICIDQNNAEEKSQQVRMMDVIYRSADTVFVWLGECSFTTRRALRVLKAYESAPDAPLTSKNVIAPSMGDVFDATSPEGPGNALNRRFVSQFLNMACVQQLMLRNWFSRTWVIQEVTNARNLRFLVGKHEVPEDTIINGLKYVVGARKSYLWSAAYDSSSWTETEWILHRCHTVLTVLRARHFYNQGHRWSLHLWLSLCWNTEVSDARDKFYAIISLADPDSTRLGPTKLWYGFQPDLARVSQNAIVDYNKPPWEVFIDCTKCMLFGEPGIFTLSLASRASVRRSRVGPITRSRLFNQNNSSFAYGVDSLPTWVPDFTIPPQPKPFLYIQWHQSVPSFRAALMASAAFNTRQAHRVLHARAVQMDTVIAIGEDFRAFEDMIGPKYLSGEMLRFVMMIGEIYHPTNEPAIRALWRTLIADMWNRESTPLSEIEDHFNAWLVFHVLSSLKSKGSIIQNQFIRLGSSMSTFTNQYKDAPQDTKDDPSDRYMTLEKNWKAFKSFYPEFNFKIVTHEVMLENHLPVFFPSFNEIFVKVFHDRRIFITDKGYLGLGPSTVREGDVVVFIAGGYVPYLFRQALGITNSWNLIGEAYIHGLMYGEFFRNNDATFDSINIV